MTKNIINPLEIGIYHILDVKTLIEKIYPNGSVFEFRHERRSAIDSVKFYLKLEKLPMPEEIKATNFPNSKLVVLHHRHNQRKTWIVIRNTTHKELYFLLQYFQTGYQGYKYNNKFDRYRSLYLAYENLVRQKRYKFVAVRHALSHAKLDNTKAVKTLLELFNDEKIDINKRKHAKILTNIHEELLKDTELALVKLIIKLSRKSQNRIGGYIIL